MKASANATAASTASAANCWARRLYTGSCAARRRDIGASVMLPSRASDILDPLVNAATNVIDATGLAGVFVLMTLESACIPIPSEAIMLFAGFNVSEGNMTLFGIVAAGVLGNLVGSLIAYAAGYYGRIELLDQNRLIHINRKHLESADRWFERARARRRSSSRACCPIVRTFISLPAGSARMPLGQFVALHRRRLHSLGAGAGDHRPGGRRPAGRTGGIPPLPRLRRGRRDRRSRIVYLVVRRRRAGAPGGVDPSGLIADSPAGPRAPSPGAGR